ncbi:1188_t:CDS:1, partial [Funneliformis geosporum]
SNGSLLTEEIIYSDVLSLSVVIKVKVVSTFISVRILSFFKVEVDSS